MRRTFYFNQGDYDLDFSPGGICATLSAKWIQLMRDEKGSGSTHRHNALENAVFSFGPVVQQMAERGFDSLGDLRANLSGLIRHAGESVIQTPVQECNGLVAANTLKNFICAERRTGVHLTFSWTEGVERPAHTIAFWRSGTASWHGLSGHVYCFDPNSGEYRGNKSGFPDWFRRVLMPRYANAFNWTYYCRILAVSSFSAPKFGMRVM